MALALTAACGTVILTQQPAQAVGENISVTLTTADLQQALTPQPGIALGAVSSGAVNLSVDNTETYQTIDGFGAAFTDSSAYLLHEQLDATTRDRVMHDLFDRGTGIGLSFMRVPMGASDYTATPADNPAPYSYDDTCCDLSNFSIDHDRAYIIPILRQAQALNLEMKLFATAWSAPAWMKQNNSMLGGSDAYIRQDMYEEYTEYNIRFLQAYEAAGVDVWGLTPLNEPSLAPPSYPQMLMTAEDHARLITDHFVPALQEAGLDTVILGADDVTVNRAYASTLLNNPGVYDAIYGTAWHCYGDDLHNMRWIQDTWPDKPIYETECSTGPGIAPMNAAQLALESTFNGASGVQTWNLALDTNGGPKMGVGCERCTGLITIDQNTGTVSYNDNYYQLGHFSKFVEPGATRIGYSDGGNVWAQAYRNPDGSEVLVAHNNNTTATGFTVTWNSSGSFQYELPAGATVTFTKSPNNGTAQIRGQASGRCLDDTGNPANGVQQYIWDCGTGSANQYYLYSAARELRIAGKCLSADGNGTANGTDVITWDCNGTRSQQWTFHADGSITNDLSGRCLDVTGLATANGSAVQLWSCHGGSNQKWTASNGA